MQLPQRLRSVRDLHLVKDTSRMEFDRVNGQEYLIGDLVIGQAVVNTP